MRTVLIISIFLLLDACAKSGDFGQLPELPERIENISDNYDPLVDILFVIDNSGSMGSHQANLAQNIGLFIDQIKKNVNLNFHIGVISTDMSDSYQRGKLQGLPKFVSNTTP